MGVRTIYFGESFNKVNEFSFYFANKKTNEKSKYIIKRKDGNLLLGLWECVSKIYEQ